MWERISGSRQRVATIDEARTSPPPSVLAPINLADPAEVAAVLRARRTIGTDGYGLVLANPVPPEAELDRELHDRVLAAGLAAQYMDPLSALPGAVFSVWHNVSGALFAAWCRRRDRRS